MSAHETRSPTYAALATAPGPSATGTTTTARGRHWGGPVVGGFYLVTGGVHVGIVSADPQTYRPFADAALLGFVREGWREVVMASPEVYGLLLAAGEVVLGTLLLRGGRAATVGWVGVVVFHLMLMLFGVAFWSWSLPAVLLLVVLARRDRSSRWGRRSPHDHTGLGEGR